MLQTLLATLMLLPSGGPAAETPLESIQSRSLCALRDQLGEMDVIPHGKDGVAVRITTEYPKLAFEGLKRLFFMGKPPGISEVRIVKPKPKMAFVIDDLGLHPDQIKLFWGIREPLTWAILPEQKLTKPYGSWLKRRFASILVHVPMEPENKAHMTLKGFIRADQSPAEQLALFGKHLLEVPGALGFNNHMGSRLTADSIAMAVMLRAVPPSWVVLDSRTSAKSQLARLAKTRFATAERTLFVDNDRRVEAIVTQLEIALADAIISGHTIAIGHAYPETAEALKRFLKLHAHRFQLVPVERLAKPIAQSAWQRRCPLRQQAQR